MVAIPIDKLKEALEGYELNPDTIDAIMALDSPEEAVDVEAIKEQARDEVEAEWKNRYREAFFKGAETIVDAATNPAGENGGNDEDNTMTFDELIYGEEK